MTLLALPDDVDGDRGFVPTDRYGGGGGGDGDVGRRRRWRRRRDGRVGAVNPHGSCRATAFVHFSSRINVGVVVHSTKLVEESGAGTGDGDSSSPGGVRSRRGTAAGDVCPVEKPIGAGCCRIAILVLIDGGIVGIVPGEPDLPARAAGHPGNGALHVGHLRRSPGRIGRRVVSRQ